MLITLCSGKCVSKARVSPPTKDERRNAARRRETMKIRKQGREEKERKNVVSRTEVVIQDENVTNGP